MDKGAKMKRMLFFLVFILSGSLVSCNAFADRYHGHYHGRSRTSIGIMFGGPIWPSPAYAPYYPYYPYAPYYPYPQTVVLESKPTTYLEKAPEYNAQHYWYYCSDPKGYYPYVLKCNANWQRVIPFPEGTQ